MSNKNNNVNNGIGSGFLLGFILGVLVTLLLTTKKGREILKEWIDKGIQKISDLEESMEKAKKPQKTEEENDYVKPKTEEVKKEIRSLLAESNPETQLIKQPKEKTEERKVNEKGGKQEIVNPTKATRRLFFRKTQKNNL
jgi:gas vesicle protein